MSKESKVEELSRLEQELADLKAMLPEHCSGTQSYVSAHRASPAHWQRIEDLEEEIKKLKAQLSE